MKSLVERYSREGGPLVGEALIAHASTNGAYVQEPEARQRSSTKVLLLLFLASRSSSTSLLLLLVHVLLNGTPV